MGGVADVKPMSEGKFGLVKQAGRFIGWVWTSHAWRAIADADSRAEVTRLLRSMGHGEHVILQRGEGPPAWDGDRPMGSRK